MQTTFTPHPSTRVIDAFQAPVRYRPEPRRKVGPLTLARGSIQARLEEAAGHLWAATQLLSSVGEDAPRYRTALLRQITESSSANAELSESLARGIRAMHGARECA